MSVHPRNGLALLHQRAASDEPTLLSAAVAEMLAAGRAVEAEKRTPFRDWAMTIPEPKSGTLDFTRFPFQHELYETLADDAEVVVKKGTQVGVSAWLLRWALYWADIRGRTALYIFPKARHLNDFADARVRPLVQGSRYLRGRVPSDYVQNKGLKQIGRGFVYFRGSESKDDLDAVDADVLALDEYDSLTQANIPDAERRIGASADGLIRRVGVPSVPGYGISRFYEQSDQRLWHVRCEGCSEWQPIDFWANVDQDAMQVVCRACRKPLEVANGEWVATYPDRSVKGYHVTQLLVPQANLGRIVAASTEREPYRRQTFWNKDLGLDFAPEEGRLSLAALQAAQAQYTTEPGYAGANLVTAGIDVASTRALNVRISEHFGDGTKRALFLNTVESFDELCLLMERYRVHMAGIDSQPERRLAHAFAERFAGRVYLISYGGAHQRDVLTVDEDRRQASVRRLEALDATLEQIRLRKNLLPLDLPAGYVEQMQSPTRFAEEDELGRQTVGYRSTGPDDYAHAETYDLVAEELWNYRQEVQLALREEFRPLDDLLEFTRSDLNSYGPAPEYSPGPREPTLEELQGLYQGEWVDEL